jgi:integrase
LVGEWIASIGLDPLKFGTHSLRRTKATLIYRRTGTGTGAPGRTGYMRPAHVFPRRLRVNRVG